jgi:hypothetical protein
MSEGVENWVKNMFEEMSYSDEDDSSFYLEKENCS